MRDATRIEAMTTYQNILTEVDAGVGIVTLNRPERHNAFDDAMIAELSDARVMLVARSISQASRKIVTTSADGATAWTKPTFHEQLWEPICMASIASHPSKPGTLLFSNPHTLGLDQDGKPVPAGRGKRENLCIKLSRDDGKTWPVNKVLDRGKAAYSDLAVLPDGTVLCLYEADTSIDCARFNLEWVTH